MTERQVLTLRLPPELHEQLRTHAFLTRRPINQTLTEVVTKWMEGPGRDEMVRASTARGREIHRVALDKLQDL
jgi:hypothetical protein